MGSKKYMNMKHLEAAFIHTKACEQTRKGGQIDSSSWGMVYSFI